MKQNFVVKLGFKDSKHWVMLSVVPLTNLAKGLMNPDPLALMVAITQ